MAWTIDYLPEAERDLELIFSHLFESYVEFGDSPGEAALRATRRLAGIREGAFRLTSMPYIGTLRPEILPNVRFVRRSDAALWFTVDDARKKVVVVGIFFGTQDHTRRMLIRLLGDRY